MFDWLMGPLKRAAAAIYRIGQTTVEAENRVAEEQREAVRAVRDALAEAMTAAEEERERGDHDAGSRALVAANRASSVVHEVEDDEARRFIREWKATFDASPKGYKNSDYGTRGYPEPGWSELRAAADRAHDRLGLILRETRDGKK